jgi:hypothetical protein
MSNMPTKKPQKDIEKGFSLSVNLQNLDVFISYSSTDPRNLGDPIERISEAILTLQRLHEEIKKDGFDTTSHFAMHN